MRAPPTDEYTRCAVGVLELGHPFDDNDEDHVAKYGKDEDDLGYEFTEYVLPLSEKP